MRNKLIEPELKPDPLRGDIFVFHLSHYFQQLSFACISGGRGPSLSTSLTSHSHDLRPRNDSFINGERITSKKY